MAQTLKSAKQEIKAIAKLFGVKLSFVPRPDFSGSYNCMGGINIGEWHLGYRQVDLLYSTFFHELQHYIAHCSEKFFAYHSTPAFGVKTKESMRIYKIALRAERWTDKEARKLCKKWKPNVRYWPGYRYVKYSRRWWNQYLRWKIVGDVPEPEDK
jgi:hypothetical protein